MDKSLYSIIKDTYDKYGPEHYLTIKSVQMLSPFIKKANEYSEIQNTLDAGFDVNIDELVSLFHPDGFEFEKQEIGSLGVEK